MVRKLAKDYVPDRGHICWIDFSPIKGHEQEGLRPGLVISSKRFNQRMSLAMVVPITSKKRGYPFEIEFKTGKVGGFLMAYQNRTLDWKERVHEFIDMLPDNILSEVQSHLHGIIFYD